MTEFTDFHCVIDRVEGGVFVHLRMF